MPHLQSYDDCPIRESGNSIQNGKYTRVHHSYGPETTTQIHSTNDDYENEMQELQHQYPQFPESTDSWALVDDSHPLNPLPTTYVPNDQDICMEGQDTQSMPYSNSDVLGGLSDDQYTTDESMSVCYGIDEDDNDTYRDQDPEYYWDRRVSDWSWTPSLNPYNLPTITCTPAPESDEEIREIYYNNSLPIQNSIFRTRLCVRSSFDENDYLTDRIVKENLPCWGVPLYLGVEAYVKHYGLEYLDIPDLEEQRQEYLRARTTDDMGGEGSEWVQQYWMLRHTRHPNPIDRDFKGQSILTISSDDDEDWMFDEEKPSTGAGSVNSEMAFSTDGDTSDGSLPPTPVLTNNNLLVEISGCSYTYTTAKRPTSVSIEATKTAWRLEDDDDDEDFFAADPNEWFHSPTSPSTPTCSFAQFQASASMPAGVM